MPLNSKYTNVRAALLTPPGFGGIAVIGISGPGIETLLSEVFTCNIQGNEYIPGKYYLGEIRESDQVIDQVMVVLRQEYRGLQAEINCHGGPRVVQRILLLLGSIGVNIISWQFLNDCLSIESEQDYVLSTLRTELAVKAVANQFPGGLASWSSQMSQNISSGSISLDYYRRQANALLETTMIARRLTSPSKVYLAGPPNAGKSTLANLLTGRSQSLVSDQPGTTRDWTSELSEMAQIPVELIDTAGRRQDGHELEMLSVARLDQMLNMADLVIILISVEDLSALGQIVAHQIEQLADGVKYMVVLSKSELVEMDILAGIDYLAVSAITEHGINQLRQNVREKLGVPLDFDPQKPLVFTARQESLIRATLSAGTQDDVVKLLDSCLGSK